MFLCDDFMLCTTNNSPVTTMLGATVKLFHHLGRTLCPQQGNPSYRTNISTSSDALAQAMSKALTDSLPGILAALHNHNVIPSQPTPLNSNSTVISTSSPAPLTQDHSSLLHLLAMVSPIRVDRLELELRGHSDQAKVAYVTIFWSLQRFPSGVPLFIYLAQICHKSALCLASTVDRLLPAE